MDTSAQVPFRKIDYVDRRVEVERRADGSVVLTNPHPMGVPPATLIEPLRRWAREVPDRLWMAERGANDQWRRMTYGEGEAIVRRIAAGLVALDMGLGQKRHGALMILSGNSLEHAQMMFGAMAAGVPVAPVSRAYSLMSQDHAKLRHVYDLIEPRAIFVQDGRQFENALAQLDLKGVTLVVAANPPQRRLEGAEIISFAGLCRTEPSAAAENAYAQISHDTIAKFLFTSGSTGLPKAVINTQGMMCINSVMAQRLVRSWESDEPPVSLSWLPWNHTFGGNAVINVLLHRGGTLYIDGGQATPQGFEITLRNLREIAPTTYSNVPAGYALLADALECDAALARHFFSRLKGLSYGGAALSQDIYDRIQAVAARTCGERIMFSSGYGSTETAPTIMNVHWATERMGLLGLPLPGIAVKLVPQGSKFEVRVKGPAVTPGYYKRPDLTAKAFDDDGFYSLGDAAKFVDPDNPHEGLVFDGRIAEDFKLSSGTWVNAGRLRVQLLEASAGLLQDAVIAGQDRDYVSALAWPNVAACRRIAGDGQPDPGDIACHPAVLGALAEALARHNARHPGSSTQVRRLMLLNVPPSLDAGEVTDKGYINQAAALSHRAQDVEMLYADPPGHGIVQG